MPTDDEQKTAAESIFPKSVLKLLERMRRSQAGWGETQARKLYRGFGFVERDVGNHVCYYHPTYRQVQGQVPRHRDLREYVIEDAVAAADEVLRLSKEGTDAENAC